MLAKPSYYSVRMGGCQIVLWEKGGRGLVRSCLEGFVENSFEAGVIAFELATARRLVDLIMRNTRP